ncbi:acetylxylan esterase [Actinotalea sp. M2MS4P-6]|uniref:acetylxylan esterase n=1 Tax=Actinotalea sp. M2MS4P-6 TaxID=2983762 RepID=UPI0021E49642|nr:acetylxylan esterase [Actinotalea sp. M2MS4P-6]MCV2394471.1 acetylxylan esterase [Actinotalea sp. M2MS4P-6]
MPLTDMPLEELRRYRPDLPEPSDLDDFWASTLAQARDAGGDIVLEAAPTPITALEVLDLTFPGFGGEPVRAWVTRPRTDEPLPTVIEYNGYNGGRGRPGERMLWAAAGFVHVFMDNRGQGSGWGGGGDTPDPHGSGPSFPGFMTRGIESRETYYFRRLYTDGVRLVDAVRDLPFVDAERVAVTGGSQGGGIAIAVAGLTGPAVRACLPDVPFLCDFRRSVEMTPEAPFTEITSYLAVHRGRADAVLATLSGFDAAALGRRAQVPALFSVALMDGKVLPSTVFAAYHAWGERAAVRPPAEIAVYPHNGHEGGQWFHWERQVEWLRGVLS